VSESPARVLVVEDDPATASFLGNLLGQDAYRVSVATDGPSALRMAREERPDLILLDVLLPEMSGFEVCQRLRQDPTTCLFPIILVTALGETKDKITGLKLGADEYVSKPFHAVELLARIERVIRRYRDGMAANPLTGLPTGVALEEELRRRLARADPFSLGWLDVTGLPAFNRVYGYERGDHVIRLVGMILRSAVLELADKNDLAVHRGGAHFALVSTPPRVEVVVARALETSDALLLMQYDEPDRLRGRLEGESEGLLALKAGIVDVEPGAFAHPVPVQEAAQEALQEAHGIPGPHLARRRA
jgi:PleD family two-component response regulator